MTGWMTMTFGNGTWTMVRGALYHVSHVVGDRRLRLSRTRRPRRWSNADANGLLCGVLRDAGRYVGRHRALRKARLIGICGDRIVCRHYLDRRGTILDVSFLGDRSQLSPHALAGTRPVHHARPPAVRREPLAAVADSMA